MGVLWVGRWNYSNSGSHEKYRIIPKCCYRRKFYDRLNGFLPNPPVTALIPATAISEYPRCHWLQDTLRFQDAWMVKSLYTVGGFPGGADGKESTCNAGDPGLIPQWGGSLEKEMATHSSILAWKIPWTEEPGRPRSMVLQRVRHDWGTWLSFFLSFWRRKWQPTPRFLPGTSHGQCSLSDYIVHKLAKSRRWLSG